MSKVIEVDFLPKETDAAFSWLDSIGDSPRRILIVDNDRNSTHLVKVLLEKDRKSTRLNSSHTIQSRMPSSA